MELTIPGYKIFEQIGEGGMARVYRARHIRLDRNVALKVMLRRYSKDNSFCERFIREARIAANLNHHNIVQIYDVNRYQDTLFLSMEYVEGGDLTDRLQRPFGYDSPVDEGSKNGNAKPKLSAAEVIKPLALALEYAHEQGYIHRDIKPANILFRDNDSLALSDFGIARAIHSDTHMTQTGMVVGTPSYMSPEQAQGKKLSHHSDLYSVAVIAYQLVLGHLPYQADSSISVAIKHISDPIPQLPAGFEGLQAFFDKALAKNPDDRYPSGASLAEAFSEGLASVSPSLPHHNYDGTTMLNTASTDTSIEASVTTSANADFDAVTLADHQVNQLETAVLDSSGTLDAQNAVVLAEGEGDGYGNRTANAASDTGRGRQNDETELVVDSGKTRANDDALSGDFMAASQATINLFFMQINRIKILIQEPDKKLRYSLLLLAFVVGVTGIFFFQARSLAPGASQHQPLSPGQMVRVGQLLSAADQDVAAGRLLAPSGENAYEKYLAILAMSPKDPVAIEGIDKIVQSLALQAQQYLREQRASEAEAILAQMRDIRPDAEQVERLEQALASSNSERVEQLTRDLQDARAAEKALDFSRAIALYQGVLVRQKRAGYDVNNDVNSNASTEAKDALERIAKASVSAAKSAAKRNDFSVAEASLGDALAAVNALGDTSVRGKARIETLNTFRDTLNQRQSEKRFSDNLSSLIASGKSALRQGHIDYINVETVNGNKQHRKDNSAYFYFSKALEKSPSNASARRGLEQVYQGIAEQAKNALATADFPLAQERIKRLREVAPRHADVSTLRRNVKLRQREVAREVAAKKKIANLYQRADTYFEAGRAKSVEKIYKQIESLVPSDKALPALKKKVADAYATLAQREIDGQDWRDANVWVDRGLVYAPEHPRLLKIRALANQKLSTAP